jgi:subtilisin-like proprotein convertase family protein
MSRTITDTPTASAIAKTRPFTFVGNGGAIPDGNGSFQDEIVVTDRFEIADISISFNNFVHTWVGDLVVRLCHRETGTAVDLVRRPGQPQFSSSGYNNDLNGDYRFTEGSTYSFEVAAAENAVIPSGTYAGLQSLSAFRGLPSTGTWQLVISDCSAGDSGSLGSWSLNLQ